MYRQPSELYYLGAGVVELNAILPHFCGRGAFEVVAQYLNYRSCPLESFYVRGAPPYAPRSGFPHYSHAEHTIKGERFRNREYAHWSPILCLLYRAGLESVRKDGRPPISSSGPEEAL